MRQGMPYLVVGGVGFYERKEVKDLLAYLRLVRNPQRPHGAAPRPQRPAPGASGPAPLDEIERAAAERGDLPVGRPGAVVDGGAPARAGHPAPARASAS